MSERRINTEGERRLKEAGWERVEAQGRISWRRPDTGHLYPRGPAYDVHKREGGAE